MADSKTMQRNFNKLLSKYSIYVDGKCVKSKIENWKKALAHAQLENQESIFGRKPQKVEILNIWTGEIITIEEAEKRAAKALSAVH